MRRLSVLLLLLLAGCAHIAQPARQPPARQGILGEWFDIDGYSWSVVDAGDGMFILVPASDMPLERIAIRRGPLGKDIAGKLQQGRFTSTYNPIQYQNNEIPTTVYEVDSRTPGVLIVRVSSRYQWSQPPAVISDFRIELTRDKGLLARPATANVLDPGTLRTGIQSADWNRRREAIRWIAANQPLGAEKDLVAALGDEFTINRILAIRGLAGVKDPAPALPALLSCLLSQHPQLERAAASTFAQLGPRIAPGLLPFLADDPALDKTWASLLKDEPKPPQADLIGWNVARKLTPIFAAWDAAELRPLGSLLASQPLSVRTNFLFHIAPGLKPAGPATDLVQAFMDARNPFTTDYMESDVDNAIRAIGRLADARAPAILARWAGNPGAKYYAVAFQEARSSIEAARPAATRSAE